MRTCETSVGALCLITLKSIGLPLPWQVLAIPLASSAGTSQRRTAADSLSPGCLYPRCSSESTACIARRAKEARIGDPGTRLTRPDYPGLVTPVRPPARGPGSQVLPGLVQGEPGGTGRAGGG